jgi:hypothetical protein
MRAELTVANVRAEDSRLKVKPRCRKRIVSQFNANNELTPGVWGPMRPDKRGFQHREGIMRITCWHETSAERDLRPPFQVLLDSCRIRLSIGRSRKFEMWLREEPDEGDGPRAITFVDCTEQRAVVQEVGGVWDEE